MPSLSVSQPFQTVHPNDLTAAGLVTLATPGKYGPDSSLISNTVVLQWFTGNAPAPRAALSHLSWVPGFLHCHIKAAAL